MHTQSDLLSTSSQNTLGMMFVYYFTIKTFLAIIKDVLLNRIEQEYIYCDTNLAINGRF